MKAKDRIVKTTEENCHNTLDERLAEQDELSFPLGVEEGKKLCEVEIYAKYHKPLSGKLPLITKDRFKQIMPKCDCGGREYPEWEREDIARFMEQAAGIQRDTDTEYYEGLTEEGKKQGIQKVVDWMKLHKAYLVFDEGDLNEITMLNREWQAKLKEWKVIPKENKE